MSTSAIVMMLVGCIGLWGGCACAITYAMRHSKKQKSEEQKDEEK